MSYKSFSYHINSQEKDYNLLKTGIWNLIRIENTFFYFITILCVGNKVVFVHSSVNNKMNNRCIFLKIAWHLPWIIHAK